MTSVSAAKSDEPMPVLLVTGPSGAGRSTALNALEDLGFETIDNIPLTLLPRLLGGRPIEQPLALGVDVRTRAFSVEAVLELIAELRNSGHYAASTLYLDCKASVLIRRYSETRRSHPLARDSAPAIGIEMELNLLEPLRRQADVLLDTSEMTVHDLRDAIIERFGEAHSDRLAVTVQSFSFKRGVPQDLDTMFDVRFLANPHWEEHLRDKTGQSADVSAYVQADPRFDPFFSAVSDLMLSLLPSYQSEGKTHFSVGFGCTGGKHRSVAVTELLAKTLADAGWRVSIRHREIEHRAPFARMTLGTSV